MTQSKLDHLWRAYASQSRSITLVRWLGYSLLLLTLLDLGAILTPLKLMNPQWEFYSIGAIVERIPVPLIGFVMVYWGEQDYRRPRERLILKVLTWFALGFALILLAFIPLCVVDSFRIYNTQIQEINAFQGQNLALIKQLEDKLSATASVDEFQDLLNRSLKSRTPRTLDTSQSLPGVKAQIPTLLEPARSTIDRQVQAAQDKALSERPGLLKRTVKWSLGALIGAVMFGRIWQGTRWARKKSYL